MQDDLFGQPTSLSTAAGIEAWNAAQRGFLAHAAATPERLAQVLLAEPDFALGHAARGLFCLLLGRREMVAAARDSLEAARAAPARPGARPPIWRRWPTGWRAGRAARCSGSRRCCAPIPATRWR